MDQAKLNFEVSNRELYSRLEILGEFRKTYAEYYQSYRQYPLFIEATKLHFKLAKTANPETTAKPDEFLNY